MTAGTRTTNKGGENTNTKWTRKKK